MKWSVKADCLVDDGFITWEVEAESAEEAASKGCQLANRNSVADSGTIKVEPLEEDKQLICNKLLEVLWLTRNLYDVVDLAYDPLKETVTALFESGYTKIANVEADSGTALIKDVIGQIL